MGPGKRIPEKWVPGKRVAGKWVPGKRVAGKWVLAPQEEKKHTYTLIFQICDLFWKVLGPERASRR